MFLDIKYLFVFSFSIVSRTWMSFIFNYDKCYFSYLNICSCFKIILFVVSCYLSFCIVSHFVFLIVSYVSVFCIKYYFVFVLIVVSCLIVFVFVVMYLILSCLFLSHLNICSY